MEEIYGVHTASDYSDRALMSPENDDSSNLMMMMMIPEEYHHLISSSSQLRIPMFGSEANHNLHNNNNNCSNINNNDMGLFQSCSEVASINPQSATADDEDVQAAASTLIKAKIASHPSYPKLLHAYIDCQKVGAPPEIACLLDEIRRENDFCKRETASIPLGADPELDEFMETYYDILVKYKSDLSRPFDEATSFLNNIETQLGNLCKDDGVLTSDDEVSGGENELQDPSARSEDQELKDQLLRRYGTHIRNLKLEFSKKKKKGKLPKEARQILLEWWNIHYKWPYPTEADKISLAESTGLDQKQINNWFINQRKRHWKPSENMQLAVMDNLSGHFFTED